jgi:hypothetical protein
MLEFLKYQLDEEFYARSGKYLRLPSRWNCSAYKEILSFLCLIIRDHEWTEISTTLIQNWSIISEHLANWHSWLLIHWPVYCFF